jgi:regulatory protein
VDKIELYSKIYGRLLSFISYKHRTQTELSDKLDKILENYKSLSLDDSTEIKNEIIQNFKDQKYIDDEFYATEYVKQKINSKNPYSKNEIKNFLYKKGIPRDIIQDSLKQYTDEIELRNIELISKKKANKSSRQIEAYLIRRGFSYDNVRTSLDSKV